MTDNVCKKCGDDLEGCKFGSVTVTVAEQTAILEKLRVMHVQIDELTHNMERGVTMRIKNTLESNADLKLEVRNLRAELTDQRTSNKAVTAERDKLHSELVDVRSALDAATEERDSLRITLDAWEQADTKPIVKVEVAEHVVPPIMNPVRAAVADYQDLLKRTAEAGMACSCSTHPHPPCSHCQPINDGNPEPDPANDAKDAALEFRNVVPTPEMLKHVGYWDLVSGAAAIAFKPGGLRLVFWRISGSQEWRTDPCPQPLKPHGMTWQQLDKLLADKVQETQAAPVHAEEVPMCMTCHECGSALVDCSQGTNHHDCPRHLCPRTCTGRHGGGFSPYSGPCKSAHPVRHE